MLLINFKTYPQAAGENAKKLAQKLAQGTKTFPNIQIGFAPPQIELSRVKEAVDAPLWAQHLDPAGEGQFTGYSSPANAKKAGIYGTFLNHSEHKLEKEVIEETVKICQDVGLKVLLFVASPQEARTLSTLSPDFVAYEPPELIGGDVSVTSSKPEVIKKAVESSQDIPLLVGAGIKSKEDIEAALSFGAAGAVVSSGVVKAPDPQEALSNLLSGFKT